MLVLHDMAVLRGELPVLRRISLQVPARGVLFVVGAGGAGKSSLLRALAHDSCDSDAIRSTGKITFNGYTIAPPHVRIARAAQDAHPGATDHRSNRHDPPSAESRRALEVIAILQQPADLYLLDEPTAGLDEAAARAVRAQIVAVAQHACVVVATHNRLDCLAAGGHTALLAGGTLQECTETTRFFTEPTTAAGRRYVDSGSCNLPCETAAEHRRDGIWWLVPGLLCGMSRPGISTAAAEQFATLHDGGVRVVVCTEEHRHYAADVLRDRGLELHHFPIPDMAPPSFAQAVDVCRLAEQAIQVNRGVAVHCRGGLGRTGTVLAAILIWLGDAADVAIARVRARKPLAIQTPAQTRFLHDFAGRLRDWHPQRLTH